MGRVYLPFTVWPEVDRKAWETAIAEGDVLDDQGPAAHWAKDTRRSDIQHYARWLGFLMQSSDLAGMPADRVTKENVQAYVRHLQARIAPRTVVSSLVGLNVMIKAMAPEQNWRWLKDICNRLNRNAKPSKDKRARMLDSGVMFRTALEYLDQLSKTDLSKRKQLVGFRNGLMVALMTACPLRLKNFAGLTLDTTLRRVGDGWLIKIPGAETKNKRPLELSVPNGLTSHIQTYLERVRREMANPAENAMWVSWNGCRLAYHMVYVAFSRITPTLFGKSINPHLFRDCAATTLATQSLKAVMAAPGLLGHSHPETTAKYYTHAGGIEASRKMNEILLRHANCVKRARQRQPAR